MGPSETPIQPEWTRAAFDLANEVRDLVATIRVHRNVDVDLASNDLVWTVAVPVAVGPGIPVADDAPEATAVGLALDAVAQGVPVIEPGDRMRIVGGTNGHMGWQPATRVFEVQSGALTRERVQFILEPDPRPAGEAAASAAVALLRADEPVLADPRRLAALHRAVALQVAATDSPRQAADIPTVLDAQGHPRQLPPGVGNLTRASTGTGSVCVGNRLPRGERVTTPASDPCEQDVFWSTSYVTFRCGKPAKATATDLNAAPVRVWRVCGIHARTAQRRRAVTVAFDA